jgi:hypothetical protein
MLLLDEERLNAARQFAKDENGRLHMALRTLKEQAEHTKETPFLTVMDKQWNPPSGNKHDYLSFGPYWWPNPNTADGLPYVRRDGYLNPDTEKTDKIALRDLMHDVEILALAYFYTGSEPLAEATARRLRAWFLDPQTRMNPHLEYGQAVPGVCEGRGIGIIDTSVMRLLPDLLRMLEASPTWTKEESEALKIWMANYLEWLLTSKNGRDEAEEHNNHGTWYDVQVALLALATERNDIAQAVLSDVIKKRLEPHLAPDGSQPHELARTRSFSYSCYNLTGLFDLATLAKHVGIDLWNWQSESGASLRRSLEYLVPYADRQNQWPYQQVVADDGSQLFALLRRANASIPEHQSITVDGKGKPAEQTTIRFAQLELTWPII